MGSPDSRARAVWRTRLGSACRTSFACFLVWSVTTFSPQVLRQQLSFQAFSYLTTVLIVSDGTLDDALMGLFHVLCATCQVAPSAVLILWLVGPANFTVPFATMTVAIGAFLVALPERTSLLCKRIGFGEIVIVVVGAVVSREHTSVLMHPVRVALCASLGALASVVAMLLPYPKLADTEVQKLCRSYMDNASETISLYLKAFSTQEKATAIDAISQAKPLAERGAKLLQRITNAEEGVLRVRSRKSGLDSGDKLNKFEIAMTGMEIALFSSPFFPSRRIDKKHKNILLKVEVKNWQKLYNPKCFQPKHDSKTLPETKKTPVYKILTPFKTINTHYGNNLAFSFFLSCTKLLQENSNVAIDMSMKREPKQGSKYTYIYSKRKRLMFAVKCSLSLFLAVLFGLIFSKENGFWSGLTIAISFSLKRQATFTLANARAQGTAFGSVYGVLGSYFLGKSVELKFLALLLWIIFTSFLRHSRMYGQAGGISAVIGALLILGRNNYGPPAEFAISRLTEAFIGLSCFIAVEIFVQPMRASTLSKSCLSKTLRILRECVNEITLSPDRKDMALIISKMAKKEAKLKKGVKELEEMVREAEVEPDFWFSPFKFECYNKLLKPISKLGVIMFYLSYEIMSLVEVTEKLGLDWMLVKERINDIIETFKYNVGSKLDYLEIITVNTERGKGSKKIKNDLEMGIVPSIDVCKMNIKHEKELIQRLQKMIDEVWGLEGEDTTKSELVMHLSAFGFCIKSFMRETKEVHKGVIDLFRWEGHSNQ